MKFALATVALAATVLAGPTDDILKGIQSDIQALDKAVQAYSGDKGPLVSAADKLVSDIKTGTGKISGGPDLTVGDAATLVPLVQGINKDGETLTNDLISKKDQVQTAKECSTVRGVATNLNSASQDLIKAIVAKTPESLQSVAQGLAGDLTKTLQKAQDAFSEANCKDASGGGSTPSGSSKPSGSSTPASSTPAGSAPASSTPATKPTGSASQSAPATVPTGAAGALAPGALIAAAVAALAL